MYEMLKEIELQYWPFLTLVVGHYTFFICSRYTVRCPTTKKISVLKQQKNIFQCATTNFMKVQCPIDKFFYGLQTLCKD